MVFTVGGLFLAILGVALGFVGHYADQPLRNTGRWETSNKISVTGGVIALLGVVALLAGTVIIPTFS